MATFAKQVDFLLNGYRDPTTDVILAGGKVTTKLAGTSTESALWNDREKVGQATNPIILGSDGTAEVFGDNIYDFVITDSLDNPVDTLSGLDYRSDDLSAELLSDIKAITGSFDGQIVHTTGYTTAGDGGGGVWYWDSSDLSTEVTADTQSATVAAPTAASTGASGAWVRLDKTRLNVKWFGAFGDGSTDNAAILTAFITHCISTQRTGYIPTGTYSVDSQVRMITTDDLSIEMDDDATIKGSALVGANPVLTIQGDVGVYPAFNLVGGAIDNSLTTYTVAVQSGTCLELVRLSIVVVDRVRFLGDTDYVTAQANAHGDSGITTVDVSFIRVVNCYFLAQPDIGFYISGDNPQAEATAGGKVSVVGCVFDKCDSGISGKRFVGELSIVGNSFYKCDVGFLGVGAGAPAINPSKTTTITGNTFRFTGTPVDLRGSVGNIISSNSMDDFGRNLDNTVTVTPTNAIRLLNCRRCLVNNNIIRLTSYVDDSHRGVNVDYTNDTGISPVDQKSATNFVSGNLISDITDGVFEHVDAVDAGESNAYADNHFVNTTTDVNVQNTTGLSYIRSITEDGTERMFIGQTNICDVIPDGLAIRKFLITNLATVVTIVSGVITATSSFMRVDTESAGATDDLDTISGGVDGGRLILRAAADARTVVLKDGTGNLNIAGDFSLDNVEDTIELIFDITSSRWLELSRSDNGA